jgi:CheY-like chemotaxis protein
MKIMCRLRGHEASPNEVCNGGECFSRCLRCGEELIKSGDAWRPLPSGFRVVWKDAPTPAADAAGSPPRREEAPPPPAVAAPQPAAPPLASAAQSNASPKHVLVCDDDELLADLLEHKLSSRGYRVTIARDGREALALLAEDRPDAILLDGMMPMVDGYEVLRRIRADTALKDVPVIMLTARKQESDIVGALGLGADDFIVKPFIPEELLSRLARLLASG